MTEKNKPKVASVGSTRVTPVPLKELRRINHKIQVKTTK